MNIKFIKQERECPANTAINKAQDGRKKIIDHMVVIDGVHVAIFKSNGFGTSGWLLYNLAGHQVKHEADAWGYRFQANFKRDFLRKYEAAVSEGLL